MLSDMRRHRLFNLDPLSQRMPRLGPLVKRPLEKMLALNDINGIYDRVVAADASAHTFSEKCLEDMDVAVKVSAADMERIPRTGPLVVVANHPFGGVEGLILASVLLKVRPDFKCMVNHILGTIPHMRPICVFVDPFGTNKAMNARGLKECLSLLRNGGCLGVFPSGEVSHLRWGTRRVEDPKWSTHIGGLIRRTGATVIPVYFEGRNGPIFQMAGLIHPRLRTAMLPRATLNRRHTTCSLQIGRLISPREIGSFTTDQGVADYLRNRTYALSSRRGPSLSVVRRVMGTVGLKKRSRPAAIVGPGDPIRLERELLQFGPSRRMSANGPLECYLVDAPQSPALMNELGRLREITFRAVGEGTGKPLDLDEFDQTYKHLIVWNREKHELVGGYRLGLSDELVAAKGLAGLYTQTLFDLTPQFLHTFNPAIELGRSFVRPEYQRGFSPLMLLWKGIGAFIAQNPRYRYLFGPVSISNAYSPLSRALIVNFLWRPENRHALAKTIRPRTPHKFAKHVGQRAALLAEPLQALDELTDLVSDIEPDGKSVPILLKQYRKLGAKSLGFNVDPAFGQCLDCLFVLDLATADNRSVDRYIGREHVAALRLKHLGLPARV